MDADEVPPRPDLAYVRRRRVYRCRRCKGVKVSDLALPTSVLALVVAVLSMAAPAFGQSTSEFPRIPWASASVRALGLGGAYQLGASRADAVFYHPAVVNGGARGFGAQLQFWSGDAVQATLAAARSWHGGTVALGVNSLRISDYTVVPLSAHHSWSPVGSHVSPVDLGQGEIIRGGGSGASTLSVHLGYARELGPLDIGVTTKLAEEGLGSARWREPLVDLGVSTELVSVTVAASYQNLGREKLNAEPRRMRVGLGRYGIQAGPLDLGFAGELSVLGSATIPAGGVEVGYWPVSGRTFVARAGLRRVVAGGASPVTLGFSFWGDEIALEWGFQPVDWAEAGGTHRFGLAWR